MRNTITNLSPRHILAAHMFAAGDSCEIVAAETGFAAATLRSYKSNETLFVQKIQEIRAQVEIALTQNTINLALRYDGLAHKATDVSEQILKDASESVELRHGTATVNIIKDVMDRAPNSPKSHKFIEGAQAQLIIQLGTKAVDNINEALKDIGRGDVVELIEGDDYNEEKDEQSKQVEAVEV